MTLDTIAIETEPLTTLIRKNVRSEVFPYFENSVPRDKPKRCGTIRLNFRHVNTLFREKNNNNNTVINKSVVEKLNPSSETQG